MDNSLEYDIDETLMRILARSKVIEARECQHCAMVMEANGFPQQAAHEHRLVRKYLRQARVAQSIYK
jgi:hypothetical protein